VNALRILFVDDKKQPSEFFDGPCTLARTAHEAVTALETQEFDVLYIDWWLSDLAPKGPTGDDVLRMASRRGRIPPKVIGISGDSVMCERLELLAEELRKERA
jgi:CheY-like chemotaxis protein